jgi:F420-non-reducing hydrogenase iron-sulfur subunit
MRRYPLLQETLRAYGIEEERVRLDWVSASEGQRFADLVDDLTERIRHLGPSRVKRALVADAVER